MRQIGCVLALALGLSTSARAAFRAQADDFRCLQEWPKVPGKSFYVFNRDPKRLQKALLIATRDLPHKRYPVGTILQFFPREAMVKRGGGFNPAGHGWEFFRLSVSPAGTEILQRGASEVTNVSGSCQGCHAAARKFDLVCEGHGVASLNLPESIIRLLQRDPRCTTPP